MIFISEIRRLLSLLKMTNCSKRFNPFGGTFYNRHHFYSFQYFCDLPNPKDDWRSNWEFHSIISFPTFSNIPKYWKILAWNIETKFSGRGRLEHNIFTWKYWSLLLNQLSRKLHRLYRVLYEFMSADHSLLGNVGHSSLSEK